MHRRGGCVSHSFNCHCKSDDSLCVFLFYSISFYFYSSWLSQVARRQLVKACCPAGSIFCAADCYTAPKVLFFFVCVTISAGISPSGVEQRHQTAVRRLQSRVFKVGRNLSWQNKMSPDRSKSPWGVCGRGLRDKCGCDWFKEFLSYRNFFSKWDEIQNLLLDKQLLASGGFWSSRCRRAALNERCDRNNNTHSVYLHELLLACLYHRVFFFFFNFVSQLFNLSVIN